MIGRYLTGGARLAGVIGWPVDHSRSPRLHGYWLEQHGIDGAYVPLAVAPDHLEQALRGLPVLGFRGANLTIPHKEKALSIVDEVTAAAGRIGAVNTVVVEADGRLVGDNTDAFGFIANLRDGDRSWQIAAGPAVLLGAGGAVRAVAVALIEAGVLELRLVNRTIGRAERLADDLRAMAAGGVVQVLPWGQREAALSGADLLVNTTSLGMEGQPLLTIDLGPLPAAALVADIVYTPLQTDLLAQARLRNNPVVDGLGMLLHQGRPGFKAWFGVDPSVTDELRRVVLGGLGA
jgi:shikimate dehydrogenase